MIVNIAEEAVQIMVELDRQVDFAEGEGLRKRWEFGMELLSLRVGKKLPNGLLAELCKETKKEARELQRRAQFAEMFPDEDALRHAVTQYISWHDIVEYALTGKPHVANNSGNNEWYTPPVYIEAARKVMGGIDVDPATSLHAQQTVQATQFYTAQDDGLTKPWNGRIWLNPPYASDLINRFIEKLIVELQEGRTTQAIALTNNATDTAWFHQAEELAALICFSRGRVQFVMENGESGAPLQGQAFFYFGENGSEFRSWFSGFGFIR